MPGALSLLPMGDSRFCVGSLTQVHVSSMLKFPERVEKLDKAHRGNRWAHPLCPDPPPQPSDFPEESLCKQTQAQLLLNGRKWPRLILTFSRNAAGPQDLRQPPSP